jgi:3'-phosphoadenosine 5'-phosphosulfate sulfotransferase (PAPS reductase)/FAD synthetase
MALNSILCWSGGKDSTASIILAHENGIHIDKIIMSEVMFSHKDNISGEDTEHIEWVRNVAIPKITEWGYDVEILRDKKDYLSLFNAVITRSKEPSRNGKLVGFPIGGRCFMNSRGKMRPIHQFKKANCNKNTIEYVGIAIDEPERLDNMRSRNVNAISLLEKYNYTEKMANDLCAENNLLSPIYARKVHRRQGCWFCPNRSIKQFAELYINEPEKWQLLVSLLKTDNLSSKGFKYGKTVQEVEELIKAELELQEFKKRQIRMFDEEEV